MSDLDCDMCGALNSVYCSFEAQRVAVGKDDVSVYTVHILVHRCANCDDAWTGGEAEESREVQLRTQGAIK
jgi:hypothetical protein